MDDIKAQDPEKEQKPHPPVEEHYNQHQDNPGPPKQAIEEYDRNGATIVLKWVIPILVLALVYWWLMYNK